MVKKILSYRRFFEILEENFCKECLHYDERKGHLWEDAECCRIEPFDACLILYLTGIDAEWNFEEKSGVECDVC